MNDAGKVAFTPKGDYSSTVTYEYLDTVVYNGNAYVALKTTAGNAPTDADTDENWKLLARGGTSVPIAKEEIAGVVKASSDIGVSDDGSMVLKTDYTEQKNLTELTSGETRDTFFGKIAKAVSTLISHITLKASSTVAGHVKVSSSTAITETGEYALDATEKNASIVGTLANQIDTLKTNLDDSGKYVRVADLASAGAYIIDISPYKNVYIELTDRSANNESRILQTRIIPTSLIVARGTFINVLAFYNGSTSLQAIFSISSTQIDLQTIGGTATFAGLRVYGIL